MFPSFVTCHEIGPFGHRGAEWDALYKRFNAQCLAAQRNNLPQQALTSLWLYGHTRYSSLMDEEILSPAGAWYETSQSSEFSVRVRQIEIARHGFPDLFETYLLAFDECENTWNPISEFAPANSAEEAFERFRKALDSHYADALAAVLGDLERVRVFAAASSPECLSELLQYPAPTMAELSQASQEIEKSVSQLRSVLEKWQGSDALRYLERRWRLSGESHANLDIVRRELEGMAGGFLKVAPERKRGRPLRGGREHVLVRTLAALWKRCGLGEPRLSPQSRFIRACSNVLPWHGVHKADVSQFVRAELGKKRRAGVLIG